MKKAMDYSKIYTGMFVAYTGALIVGTVVGACVGDVENPNHCENNKGDEYCQNKYTDRIYCESGAKMCGAPKFDMYPDGCVPVKPARGCYLPCGIGVSIDDCDQTSTTGTTDTTDTSSGTGTDTGTDTEMTTEGSTSTGPEVCTQEVGDPLCKDPMKPYCVSEECVSCVDAGDGFCEGLDPLKPACELSTGECAECVGDEHCTENPDKQVCGVENTCVECTEGKKEKCLEKDLNACTPDGKCVECVADTDCSDSEPICDVSNNECRGCEQHSECLESACHLGGKADLSVKGSCFPTGDGNVIWVNNTKDGECSDNLGTGSEMSPYCTLTKALITIMNEQPKTIKLVGGGDTYKEQAVISGKRIIAVIGQNMPEVSLGNGDASIAVTENMNGAPLLYLSQISVSNNKFNGSSVGIDCSGGEMWVSESQVNGNQQEGIKLEIGSHLILTNSIVGGNGNVMGNRGIYAVSGSDFKILYSTIVKNGKKENMSKDASIFCMDLEPSIIRNSIVIAEALESVSSGCTSLMVETSAVDKIFPGNNILDKYENLWFVRDTPAMGEEYDFHLVKSELTELKFKNVAQWKEGDPEFDIDNEPRLTTEKDWCGADVPQ